MVKLTQEQRFLYIERNGSTCPYCESDNIVTTGEVDISWIYGYQSIACRDCDEEWEDVYKLSGIHAKDDNGEFLRVIKGGKE